MTVGPSAGAQTPGQTGGAGPTGSSTNQGPVAGSITAALFLRRFVDCPRYLHFDLYCHQKADAPARPKGGVGQGARAVLAALPAVLGL